MVLSSATMNQSNQSVRSFVACAILALALVSCSGGGSDQGGTTAPAAGSVMVTGTVSGTIIKVLRADTSAVINATDTASLVNPPFLFTLSNIPVGVPIKIFFFSAGETFPLYIGNTNVFAVVKAGTIDLGFVTMGGGRATPLNQPPANMIQLGSEDPSPPPQNVIPQPATLLVATPAPATGPVIVDFTVSNFSVGGQGQQHLHIRVDNGPTRHFFNGQTKNVLDGNGLATKDVRRQSSSSFRLENLSVGSHQVEVRLATASEKEFTNTEANPPSVTVTINNPPSPPATLTITTPSQGASLPSGPVLVTFTVQNVAIGDPGTPHLHIYLDGGAVNHFFNGITNEVLGGNGQAVANITWQDTTSFQITNLSGGSHTIQLRLADGAEQELQNAEAKPPDLDISIQAPPGSATVTINSPAQNANLPPGPVLVTFDIQNSPVPLSATEPRMHFYVDNDPIVYQFFDGPGVVEDGSLSGVRYQGGHTHFVHWKSGSSIQLNALASGPHQVRFVLVDQSETELQSTEKILSFTILPGTGGDFSLQKVVGGLSFPTAMATAPDGRIFVTELFTGNIRVVTPKPQPEQWTVQIAPFAHLNIESGGEKGLLGIAVDPNFSSNHYVYAFYTAPGPTNRVVRFTATTSGGDTVATPGSATVIFDNLPAATIHNGGFIQFGPDGMLYIFVGENNEAQDAQSLSSLRGKILRINPNGTIPSDNPFVGTLSAPFSAIYSYGHRNSFGFTFHPHTDDLWETENGAGDNDQINRIIAGMNYGWPDCPGICNSPPFNAPPYVNPIITFTPPIAPTGIVAIREDSVYPAQYYNNLLFADFNVGQLHRIVLGGAGADALRVLSSHSIACNCGQGGLLAVMHGLNVPGQDGYVYVTNGDTNSDGIFRVVLNSP